MILVFGINDIITKNPLQIGQRLIVSKCGKLKVSKNKKVKTYILNIHKNEVYVSLIDNIIFKATAK